MIAAFAALLAAGAGLSPQMRDGIPGSAYVARYAPAERARIAGRKLGPPVPLTPNAPYGRGGAHLSFWKPSFVLATPEGGEAGVNFWGLYNEGHVNVGFTPTAAGPQLLDCRLLSAGGAAYKVYAGAGADPVEAGDLPLRDGHALLVVQATTPDEPISVELWPSPMTATFGFLGCDLSAIE